MAVTYFHSEGRAEQSRAEGLAVQC